MTDDQRELLEKAERSIRAASLLAGGGQHDFAASRAYYAMFYAAQALLLGDGLAFGKHSAVIAAFGQHFAKTGRMPLDLHRMLVRGQELRAAADYEVGISVDAAASADQIRAAEGFVAAARGFLAGIA